MIFGPTVSANTRIAKLAEWMGAEVVAIRLGAEWMSDRGWSEVHWRIAREQWHRSTVASRWSLESKNVPNGE